MPQLTESEQDQIDKYVLCDRLPVPKAIERMNKERMKTNVDPVDKSTVYRYVNGDTHRRSSVEKRGRTKSLSKQDEKHIAKVRRDLLRKAKGEKRVTCD